jgi:hypothetical protein
MTSVPHMGGTPGDKSSADYIKNEWIRQGLDVVEAPEYEVLLDYPDEKKPNKFGYLIIRLNMLYLRAM